MRVKGRADPLDDRWQRIIEIFILAPTEGVAFHFDPAAKLPVIAVKRGDLFTCLLRENGANDRKAAFIEVRQRVLPVDITFADWFGPTHRRKEQFKTSKRAPLKSI